MKISSKSFEHGGLIPGRCAFAVKAPKGHVRLSDNLNPELSWSGAPAGTRSFALIVTDPDAPTRPDDVNQEGREVPLKLPRAQFFHWALVDIPASVGSLEEGECSRGVTAHGKKTPAGPEGSRQGLNDYTGWFAGDPDMAGDYYGYDGPCPPWNDERLHHYLFRLYALDVPRLALAGRFTGRQALDAIYGHILDEARLVVAYSLNPALALTLKK